MNYLKVYNNLVSPYRCAGREKTKDEYYECHHIKPKSLFPAQATDENNLVLLTPREHYVAHWLLTKIYPGRSMLFAFMLMSNKAANKNFKREYKVNSKSYENLKIVFSKNNPAKTEEAKLKISQSKAGKNHHFYDIDPEKSPGFKSDIHTFVHKDGRKVTGTRTAIFNSTELSRAQVSNLIVGSRYTSKGWAKEGTKKPPTRKGKSANGADTTLYCWYNKNNGIGYVCDRHDFEHLSGVKRKSIRTLIYNTRSSAFGWVLQK